MFKFIPKLLLFFAPVLLLYIFPLYIYFKAGEFISIQDVVARQSGNQSFLFGLAYDDITKNYKEALVTERNPAVIALGTSRVLEFRSDFFKPGVPFVNAGRVAGSITTSGIDELPLFIQQLPDTNNTKIIIVGLDPWMFTRDQGPNIINEPVEEYRRLALLMTVQWRTIYEDYLLHKFSLSELTETSKGFSGTGLTAIIHHDGYLNDGSYFYGHAAEDSNYASTSVAIISGKLQDIASARSSENLDYGTSISAANIESLQRFLELCRQHHIYIIGFIPPTPHSVFEAITSTNDAHAKTAKDLPGALRAALDSYHYPLFDYSDAAKIGIKDTEFIDSAHTTDKGSLRMLIDMAEHDKVLAQYVSISDLKELLFQTKGNFILTKLP